MSTAESGWTTCVCGFRAVQGEHGGFHGRRCDWTETAETTWSRSWGGDWGRWRCQRVRLGGGSSRQKQRRDSETAHNLRRRGLPVATYYARQSDHHLPPISGPVSPSHSSSPPTRPSLSSAVLGTTVLSPGRSKAGG